MKPQNAYMMRWSEVNDIGTDVVLGYCWLSNNTSEAGSSSHDNVNGWLSGADKVDGEEI